MHSNKDIKAAEQELYQPQQLLQLVLDTIPQFVFWKDRNCVYLGCNQRFAEVAGLSSPEEIKGKTDYDLPWKIEEIRFFQKCDRRVMATGQAELGIVEPQFTSEGIQTWIKTNKSPLRNVQGRVIGILGAYHDITQEKKAEQTLKEINEELEKRVTERTSKLAATNQALIQAKELADSANQAKSKFLANMSHELRTPLNAILGFTQIMQRDRKATPEQLNNLAVINRSGEHLLALINDVLEMSKIEAGCTTLKTISCDLHHLLDTTQEMLALKADTKGLQLIFDLDPDIPRYIYTDERKLRQVLINLLNNALKFTTEGSVTLRVKPDISNINNLLFEIEDTGEGIAPEELDILFEVFSQTKSGKQSEEGTGLGLAISRQFVRLMGGDITLSSRLGTGTVFKFNIIAEVFSTEKLKSQPQIKQVIALEPNQPSYRILVVDDRWENRQIALKLLEPIGFEIKEAVNGKEAIEIWEQWQPHLIWMDMRMPVMNGYEATQYIKSHLKGQSTYIIALTASTFEEERAIVLSVGCDDFVRKPFQEAILFDKMAEYLGVKYVYADSIISSGIEAHTTSNHVLKGASLQVMPDEWLAQLGEASEDLNSQAIANLISKIPNRYSFLIELLTRKVNNFDFEEIVNLVEQAIKIKTP